MSCPVCCVCRDRAHGAGHSALPGLVRFQGFQRLKAAHAALEEEYLRACRGQPLAQQPTGSEGTPGKFDPGRCVLGREAREARWGGPGFPRSPEAHPILIIQTLGQQEEILSQLATYPNRGMLES